MDLYRIMYAITNVGDCIFTCLLLIHQPHNEPIRYPFLDLSHSINTFFNERSCLFEMLANILIFFIFKFISDMSYGWFIVEVEADSCGYD